MHFLQNAYDNNVVAALPGKSKHNEIIVFCAHYDHVGTARSNPYRSPYKPFTPPDGDNIYNGANDNASGVAAMLALAKYFGRQKNNERTILFIAFSAEELGTVGSTEFVTSINPEYFKAVINLEMLGRTHSRSKNRPYMTGYALSDLFSIMNNELAAVDENKYGKEYFREDPYPVEDLFARSDNFPFAKLGIPAHTIMAGSPGDGTYHSFADEYETLNINAMSEFVRAIALAARPLLNGSATPQRIDTRKLPN